MSRTSANARWVIGIDWATKPVNVGLCLGEREDKTVRIRELLLGSECASPVQQLSDWIRSLEGDILLALDAPLGWPVSMGAVLHGHRAGEGIGVEANRFFRRTTDTFVWNKIGKLPLEVGADRIARAALSGLEMLTELRGLAGEPIPTAWSPSEPARVRVVEVYPAATLLSYGVNIRGYKKAAEEGQERRRLISRGLEKRLVLNEAHHQRNQNTDHLLDATVCVLAGDDFLSGQCFPPSDLEEAAVEGWIWFPEKRS